MLAACSDPRARPALPVLTLDFDTAQVVRSPGLVVGTVNVIASSGLGQLQLRLATADSSFELDTLEGYAGEGSTSRAVAWQVQAGIPVGTTLHFVARARDFTGFEATDSVRFQTEP